MTKNLNRRNFMKMGTGAMAAGTLGALAVPALAIPIPGRNVGSTGADFDPTKQIELLNAESGMGGQLSGNSEVSKIAHDVLGSLQYSFASVASNPTTKTKADSLESTLQQFLESHDSRKRESVRKTAKSMVSASPELREIMFGRAGRLESNTYLRSGFDKAADKLQPLRIDPSLLGIKDATDSSKRSQEELFSDVWGYMDHDGAGNEAAMKRSAAVKSAAVNKLGFYISKVHCVDETNPEWLGDDEIAISGVGIDETGDSNKIGEVRVGNSFDDGESKLYNPHWQYTWFNTLEQHNFSGPKWPKRYSVILTLAEKDNGGFSDFLDDVWNAVKSKVKKAIEEAVTAAATTYLGPVIGKAIGKIASWVVDEFVGWIINAFKDDIFPAQSLWCDLSSSSARFTVNGQWGSTSSSVKRAYFSGHSAQYYVEYYWKLY